MKLNAKKKMITRVVVDEFILRRLYQQQYFVPKVSYHILPNELKDYLSALLKYPI